MVFIRKSREGCKSSAKSGCKEQGLVLCYNIISCSKTKYDTNKKTAYNIYCKCAVRDPCCGIVEIFPDNKPKRTAQSAPQKNEYE